MKCPVCGKEPMMPVDVYDVYEILPCGPVPGPAPLYQVSYPGSQEYVPPRCDECYDKMTARRGAKQTKKEGKTR